MEIERVKSLKRYLLIAISVLLAFAPFVLGQDNPAFHTKRGIAIYFLEILNLLVIFWLFYFISEINPFLQGKIGESLGFIILGLIIFAIQSIFVCMTSLQIPFFNEIGNILLQPVVVSIIRSVVLIFLTIGILKLVKLYK